MSEIPSMHLMTIFAAMTGIRKIETWILKVESEIYFNE